MPSSTVGNAGAPYWTAVNVASTVQPGSGTTVSLSVAPAPASAPGFWTRLPAGMSAKAAAANSKHGGERGQHEAHRPTLSGRTRISTVNWIGSLIDSSPWALVASAYTRPETAQSA